MYFLSIDNCIIKNEKIKRCDFLVTDNESIVVFVEIKEINYSGNTNKDYKKKSKYRKDAIEQLASTINNFIQKGVDLSNFHVETVIAFPPYIKNSNPTTIPSTCSQTRIAQLLRLCGYSSINEGNHIVFS